MTAVTVRFNEFPTFPVIWQITSRLVQTQIFLNLIINVWLFVSISFQMVDYINYRLKILIEAESQHCLSLTTLDTLTELRLGSMINIPGDIQLCQVGQNTYGLNCYGRSIWQEVDSSLGLLLTVLEAFEFHILCWPLKSGKWVICCDQVLALETSAFYSFYSANSCHQLNSW